MKNLSKIALLLFAPLWSVAQTMQFVSNRTIDSNKAESKTTSIRNQHLLPLFGETTKPLELIEKEIKFLEECDQNFASRKEASKFFAERGWDYIQEAELDTAMYRFNLANLLDNTNVDAFWGLGVVCFQQGLITHAERMLRKGIELDSSNVGLLVDLATVDMVHYKASKEPDSYELFEAEKLLNRALLVDGANANLFLKKAVLEFHKGNFDDAWFNIHKTRTLDQTLLDYEFLKELISVRCDPLGIFNDK